LTIKLFLKNSAINPAWSSSKPRNLLSAGLVAVFLCGCAVQEGPKIPVVVVPAVVVVPKPIALSAEADAALQAAEQGVIEARVKRALWTAAVEELKRARAAAQEFDSIATMRHARESIALCELSIAQLSKPPVKW